MPNKYHLMLLGVGVIAGFLVSDSLIAKGTLPVVNVNPFAKSYGYGFQTSSGITVV